MNELREKIFKEIAANCHSDVATLDAVNKIMYLLQSQPINKDADSERWKTLYLKLKKGYARKRKKIKELEQKIKNLKENGFYDDQPRKGSVDYFLMSEKVKELEKENERLKTLNKLNSIAKPSDWEKDALHRQLESKENQITQLQKKIEKYENFLIDLSLNHALVQNIPSFKITNKQNR